MLKTIAIVSRFYKNISNYKSSSSLPRCVWPQLLLPSLKQRLILMLTCTVAMAAMVLAILAMDTMG